MNVFLSYRDRKLRLNIQTHFIFKSLSETVGSVAVIELQGAGVIVQRQTKTGLVSSSLSESCYSLFKVHVI